MLRFVLVVALSVSALACLADAAVVRMYTVLGTIDVQLYDSTPVTRANFLRYVNDGLYDYSLFHRSDPGFVLQGGGIRLVDTGSQYELQWIPTYGPIPNESSMDRPNVFGTIAMAQVGTDPNSATSQFFFNLGDNSDYLGHLNGGFTVFGSIVAGTDVLLAIEALNVYQFGPPYAELPTLDTFTEDDYYAGYVPYLSDLVWLYSAVLLADANNDGSVDAADYVALKRNFGKSSGATWEEGDFDFDGDVDFHDKYVLEFSFGLGPDIPAGGVPEPATLALLALGSVAAMRRRRGVA